MTFFSPMPPADTVNIMSGIRMTQQPKTTNFSIAAIMSGLQKKQEELQQQQQSVIKSEPEDIRETVSPTSSPTNTSTDSDKVIVPKKEKKCRVTETSNCAELDPIRCSLDNKELWDKFCEFGTEMIITRTGRRMFPTVRVSFGNLDAEPGVKYLVLLDIVPCDNKRYRYAYHRSAWLVAGKADPAPPHRLHPHPDGPFTAEQLRKQVIGFEKVKITNNETDNTGQIILNSMHKFQPRVYLVKRSEGQNGPVTDIEKEKYRTFVFPETQFTAVTAYQNQCITKLKIESNPFAKGFRDSAGSDYDDHHSYGSPFGGSSLPGGMPGMDPFTKMHFQHHPSTEANNNLIMAAEKARLMMMYPQSRPMLPTQHPAATSPVHHGGHGGSPFPYHLPLTQELLARYSAIQASLGMYNPALLAAAALRTSTPTTMTIPTSPIPSSLNSSLSSPRSPDLPSPKQSHRFSPYIIPRSGDSPGAPHSPLSDDRAVSPPSAFPMAR